MKLDEYQFGNTKADVALVKILNDIQDKHLTKRIGRFISNSVDFMLNTIKIVPQHRNSQDAPTPIILYKLLKNHFTENIDKMDLYGHEELRIPLKCSVCTRLKKYFYEKHSYEI